MERRWAKESRGQGSRLWAMAIYLLVLGWVDAESHH